MQTEWQATDYARESGLQKQQADKQLRSLVLRGDERILDVGCGDGKITADIATRVPRGSVLGVDPSREMITFATKRFLGADDGSSEGAKENQPERASVRLGGQVDEKPGASARRLITNLRFDV